MAKLLKVKYLGHQWVVNMKQPRVWTLRKIDGKLCECYCTINIEYQSKHSRYQYRIIEPMSFDENGHIKTIPILNTNYDPRIKKPHKPLYCERKPKPSEKCYKHNCPYFDYCEYDPNEEGGVK